MTDGGRALVLGGGGVTGIAWELGLLAGLAEAGVDPGRADTVIGTSAGSSVAAQLGSGLPVRELFERQLSDPSGERPASVSRRVLFTYLSNELLARNQRLARVRLGRKAIQARTPALADRLAVIRSRLPSTEWPSRPQLKITAVDALSGELRVFDGGAGVSLIDAVAASCAIPLVWPPVPIGGRLYIDGGVRSPANADLADGASRVVVLAPIARAWRRSTRPVEQLAGLGPAIRGVLVSPSPTALQAMGSNGLDPTFRAAAARAGYAQAQVALDLVREVWDG